MGYVGGTIEIRLNKPDGDLLGQTEIAAVNPSFMAAGSAQNKAPRKIPDDFNRFVGTGIKLDIKPISGLHDIYFVFKNDKVNPDAQLMSVSDIQLNIENSQ